MDSNYSAVAGGGMYVSLLLLFFSNRACDGVAMYGELKIRFSLAISDFVNVNLAVEKSQHLYFMVMVYHP